MFPRFTHWQEGYGAFTHALPDKDRLIEYIMNQKFHHRTVTFCEEYLALLKEAGLQPNEHDELWFDD